MEAVITGVVDEYRIFRKHKELFILIACILCFLLGLPCVMQNGAYVLNLFDYQSGGVSLLFLGFFETVTLAWIYGTDRFSLDIEKMIGRRPGVWWWLCWRFFSPAIMAGIFLFSISQWGGVSYNDYKYPPWAEFFGWVLALSSMLFIPGIAMWQLYKTPGTFMEVSVLELMEGLIPESYYVVAAQNTIAMYRLHCKVHVFRPIGNAIKLLTALATLIDPLKL